MTRIRLLAVLTAAVIGAVTALGSTAIRSVPPSDERTVKH